MIAAVVGSRSFNDYSKLCSILDNYKITKIVSGGAKGADSLGERYAKEHNLEFIIHYPNYGLYGKAAPFIRNEDIIKDCDECFAFWDMESNGTKNAISHCTTYNKPCHIINCKKDPLDDFKE